MERPDGYIQEAMQTITADDPGEQIDEAYTATGTGKVTDYMYMITNTHATRSVYVTATAAEDGPTPLVVGPEQTTEEPIGPYVFGNAPFLWNGDGGADCLVTPFRRGSA